MSISVTKIVNLPQAALKFLVQDEIEDEPVRDYTTLRGVLSDSDYAWVSRGPRLEIVHTKTGNKIGAWTFGWVLKDSNTEVVCVDEIQRPNGRLPLLAVGIDCDFSGGMICVFDFVTSKIIRAIQIKEKITDLHVIDAGYDVFTLPGPLRNFDGIIAVGTAGGDVFLVDICRQICDEALTAVGLNEIRDELNPCLLCNITARDLGRIEHHKEFAIRNSHHLAIHLNIVFDKSTKHFTLKGPKGDDRIHVNKDEVRVSALYYCPQLGSLLVGYNFGALQLYNLMNLDLLYTSPVCDEHIPISHFAIQEPADDPRAVCYVWAVYSADAQYPTCLPLAVMYAFCYQTKEYHEGYGFLYQDFSSASVHYQMELGVLEGHKRTSKRRGGYCLKVNSVNHGLVNREGPHHDSNEDNLTLCIFVWNVWFSNKEIDTFLAVFDLNQWYKEQMPSVPNIQFSSTYMHQIYLTDLVNSATNKSAPILDVHTNKNSIQQFTGPHRLEEHFYPNSITFGLTCLRESDVVFLHNYGVQKALLAQIESSGPLCLVEPAEIYQEVIGLGLVPLFIDLPVNTPISTNQQREIILGAALENQLMGWICKCASEWANGSFLSTGCSLDLLISWAFQRAITLKTNCDKFCTPLFDYSSVRLDNNTNILLNSCTRQLKNLCSLYAFFMKKLSVYISNHELVGEQYRSLETVSVYFEVLQWLLNVGLLPECPLNAYPRSDDLERISAPYPAELLVDFYNHRRALLKILNEENFSSSESVLFIDALIDRECGGKTLQEQWCNDGGNGLYPPPSLQALLRTYLIDNVDLSYKHSVIIYVFLDLAMTLDQDKYKPVITHLIKFPAVFKVSPSVIKITQAFWQLDHSDYNTAMGLLLDPLISSEDLSSWHHKIVLRALMLQKQHNFALLYVQVRKPMFQEDDDIMTAISLYIANNMLDEAFYFEKHFANQKGNKFLSHLFNECKKNDKLRSLIYRSLDSANENFFLKYLTGSKQSTAEDLHVYYHILRSHFIEAFESHERTVPNQIENQGLFGQENAIPRDKLVYGLKKLLPDVNRNLLNLCHKEKSNAWQQVSRPTPMSVFVHNFSENIQYKSTIIGAALAKAKQTFNETVSEKFKMETEGTPFLRTPTVLTGSKRSSAVIVNPRVIDIADLSPPSAKRLKLSPRLNTSVSAGIPSKLDTPLVKRQTPRVRDGTEERKVVTPHSILKVKSLINHTPTRRDGEFEDNFKEFKNLEYTPVSSQPKKSGLGLSARKSLTKPSPVVRFEGLINSSSSLNNTLSTESPSVHISPEKSSILNFSTNSNAVRLSGSSKNTSTEEEVFYSPDTSLEEKQAATEEKLNELSQDVAEENPKAEEAEEREDISEEQIKASPVFSPKARRSYRRSLGPVRSSPRLSSNASITTEPPVCSPKKIVSTPELASPSKDDLNKTAEAPTDESPKVLPKLRPRKSLCRQVLETNALNSILNSPQASPRSRRSKKIETQKVTKAEESTEKLVFESSSKYEDGEETHKSSFIKRHNLTTSFVESDLDTSEEYTIDYDIAVEPKLSASILKYINSSNKSIVANNSSFEHSLLKEVDKDTPKKNIEEENEKISETIHDDDLQETIADSVVNSSDYTKLEDEEKPDETEEDDDMDQNKSISFETTVDQSKSVAYSVLDSSAEIFSLSESMVRCINNRELDKEDISQTQNEEEDEVMEVDDDEIKVDSDKDKSDELVYATLTTTNLDEAEKEETSRNLSFEDSSSSKQNKVKEAEYFDGESTSNRPIDPEMNVFEITDDLSFNDGLIIEKEVTLEENDLCYGQQNTLESVLEENIRTVSSTPLDVFEKNVFNESYASEEESNEEDAYQEEPHLEHIDEDVEASVKQHNEQPPEDEVIEIGSSSEDQEESSSSYSEHSNHERQPFAERSWRNIYDSENTSSESSYERRYSEISENSDDINYEHTKEGCGLFQGDIVLLDEEDEADEQVREEESDHENHQKEGEDGSSDNELVRDEESDQKEEEEETVQDRSLEDENVRDEESDHENNQKEEEEEIVQDRSLEDEIVREEECDHERNQKEEEEEEEIVQDRSLEDENVRDEESDHENNPKEEEEEIVDENVQDRSMEQNENKEEDTDGKDVENEVVDGLLEKTAEKVSKMDTKRDSEVDLKKPEDEKESRMEVIQTEAKEKRIVSQEKFEDVSIEMDELSYSVQNEEGITSKENLPREEETKDVEDGKIVRNSEAVEGNLLKDEPKVSGNATKLQCEEHSSEKENLEQTADAEMNKSEDTMQIDPLDSVINPLVIIESANPEVDILDSAQQEHQDKKSRKRSSSLSVKSETKSKKDKDVMEEISTNRRLTRRAIDVLSKLEMNSPKREPDVILNLVQTPQPVRSLRSRRVSTEELSTPTVSLRKRSSSVDEMKSTTEDQSAKKVINDVKKPRSQRAASVLSLPKIEEEEDGGKKKRSKSVLEDYSMNRRVTRQQITLLKKVEGTKHDLAYMDPIVLLDKVTFDGKPDPEEQKVYDSSPSTTNSTSGSPAKTGRRLRSASQASESSRRSKSKTPVRTVKGRTRKQSTDEVSNQSSKSSRPKKLKEVEEQSVSDLERRTTRSRAKSVSSINSEDLNASVKPAVGKRNKRVASQSSLQEIQEEPDKLEKSKIPKKRTRKNSSQI